MPEQNEKNLPKAPAFNPKVKETQPTERRVKVVSTGIYIFV